MAGRGDGTMRCISTMVALAFALASVPAQPHDHDPDTGSKAAERLERDQAEAAERAAERAARYDEERAKIMDREAREPARAAEDLAKLDADIAREDAKAAEDAAKDEADFEEESAKEAEDAAEDAAELADDMDDASGHGSSAEMRDLADAEAADHDPEGFPVRRGEVVAVDLGDAALSQAQGRGFRVIERERLDLLGRDLVRLATPEGMASADGLAELRRIAPGATVDFVHYYGLNLIAGGKGKPVKRKVAKAAAPAGIAIGIIDTAVGPHEVLASARIVPWAAGVSAAAPTDHGTAVASLAVGRSASTIYSANIFRGPADRPYTSADVIAQALEWMLSQDIQTINMSLAGPRNAVLDRLIRDALGQGRSIVAAAGNGGPSAPPAYPAAVSGVIAVTAVDKDARIYRYANRGRYITVSAQGVDVLAARARGGWALFTGTSFAAPHVAALVAACRRDGSSGDTCRRRLVDRARDLGPAGFDETFGYGLVE